MEIRIDKDRCWEKNNNHAIGGNVERMLQKVRSEAERIRKLMLEKILKIVE